MNPMRRGEDLTDSSPIDIERLRRNQDDRDRVRQEVFEQEEIRLREAFDRDMRSLDERFQQHADERRQRRGSDDRIVRARTDSWPNEGRRHENRGRSNSVVNVHVTRDRGNRVV